MNTLVFIPGTLCDSDLFISQIDFLKNKYNCVVADHSSSDNLTDVATGVLANIEGHMIIIGLSYGGIIAMEMMRISPERILGLVLMNTNHRPPSDKTRAMQERFVGMAHLGNFENITKSFLKDAMLHPDHLSDKKLKARVLNMAIHTGKENFYNQIKAQLGRPDSKKDMPFYNCPTLLITGSHDKVCTPALHKEMECLIPNSELQIIMNCGHLSTMEKPQMTTQVISNWLIRHF